MNGERPIVADVGNVGHHPKRVDEPRASFASATNAKSDEGTRALRQVFGHANLLRARVEAGVVDPTHLRMPFEMARHRQGILGMSQHPQMKRLEPLQELKRIER